MAERLNKRQQQNIANKHQLSCHKNIEHTVTTCLRTVNGGPKKITRRNMRTYMYLKHDHITNMYVHHLLVHEPAYFAGCINSIEWCFFSTPNNTINQIRINNKRLERQRKQRKNTHIHPHNGWNNTATSIQNMAKTRTKPMYLSTFHLRALY